jgi:hypothetical protein
MSRTKKVLLIGLLLIVAAGAAAYNFFVGFPRTFDGKRVHRVTVWSQESHLRPEITYYAYTGPGGNEVRHGAFQRFDNGHLVQEETYRDGKLDGVISYWNLFGEKTQEVYYRAGAPYGWAFYKQSKLINMRQEVMQDGRTVAVKIFNQNRYSLQFKCGELINASIDPASGQLSSIPNATQRACVQP